jgi:hypothetical protein
MAVCSCPKPTAISSISASDCPFDLKQIQKIGFQRSGYTFDSGAGVPTAPSVLADWTALMSATDDTKVVFTPLIGGDPIFEAGEAIVQGGGDNSTLNGVEDITGVNPSKFSANFKSLTPTQEKELKKLMCETSLVMYFVTNENKIGVKKITTAQKEGFNIQALFVSDRNNAGYGTKDINKISFSLPAGWSEDIELITPATGFNPLVDLV